MIYHYYMPRQLMLRRLQILSPNMKHDNWQNYIYLRTVAFQLTLQLGSGI